VTYRRIERCCSYRSCRLKQPSDAAGRGIEGLHQAARASDKDIAVEDHWLGERNDIAIEPVCPFKLEPRYVAETEACRLVGLITGVGRGRTPSIPLSFPSARESRRALRAVGCRGRLGSVAGNTKICRNRFALVLPQLGRDVVHDTEIESAQDLGDPQLLQLVARWNAPAAGIVTSGASLLIHRFARGGCGRKRRNEHAPDKDNSEDRSHGLLLLCIAAILSLKFF